jgi:hypothetical protein
VDVVLANAVSLLWKGRGMWGEGECECECEC